MKTLYHISEECHDGETFFPRVPDYGCEWVNHNTQEYICENSTIRRVCVSKTIGGCIKAIPGFENDDRSGEKYFVHVVDCDIPSGYLKKPSRTQVPDSNVTGEMWITTNAKMKCIGQIELTTRWKYPSFWSRYDDDQYTWGWHFRWLNKNISH